MQIYEPILTDPKGAVTTVLLSASEYAKDNRLLPKGFDKATADHFIEVAGGALQDEDFTGGGDRVRYQVDVGRLAAPLIVEAELWYQPIGYRWAHNLSDQQADEIDRFISYFEAMADSSAAVLASTEVIVE